MRTSTGVLLCKWAAPDLPAVSLQGGKALYYVLMLSRCRAGLSCVPGRPSMLHTDVEGRPTHMGYCHCIPVLRRVAGAFWVSDRLHSFSE